MERQPITSPLEASPPRRLSFSRVSFQRRWPARTGSCEGGVSRGTRIAGVHGTALLSISLNFPACRGSGWLRRETILIVREACTRCKGRSWVKSREIFSNAAQFKLIFRMKQSLANCMKYNCWKILGLNIIIQKCKRCWATHLRKQDKLINITIIQHQIILFSEMLNLC